MFITAVLLLFAVIHLAAQSSFTVELGSTSTYQIDKQDNITEYIWQIYTDYDLTTHATPQQVTLHALEVGRENEIEVTWNSLGNYYLTVFVISNDGCLNKMGFEFNVISNESIVAFNDSISLLTCSTADLPILENDVFTEEININVIDEPDFGTALLNEDGTITYTANCDFIGQDTLMYEISNRLGIDTATVIFNVESVLTFYTSSFCEQKVPYFSWDLSVSGITLSGIDVSIFNAEGSLIETIEDASFNEVREWPGYDPTNELYTYDVPETVETIYLDVDFNNDYFENKIDTLRVLDCDINLVVAEWDTVSVYGVEKVINVLANDFDPDEGGIDTLSLDIVTWYDDFDGPYHGDVVVNANGTISYIPNLDYSGIDSFIYTICDKYTEEIACDTAMVYITLFANDEPIAMDDYYDLNVGETGIFEVAENDLDPEDQLDLSSIIIIEDPENGNAIVNNEGIVTYQPLPDYEGLDSFQYVICDQSLPQGCDEAWVFVNIVANECVVVNNDIVYTNVMEEVNIPVLDNDFDPEGELNTSSLKIWSSADHGNVYIQPDKSIIYIPYEPYVGLDSFTYRVCDLGFPICCKIGMVYVNLVDENEQIVAEDDEVTTPQNVPVVINVLDNDYDPDGMVDITSVVVVNEPNNGDLIINTDGSILYTPNQNYFGTETFSYEVCDNGPIITCDVATVTIIVPEPDNIPPVALDDSFSILNGEVSEFSVSTNDSDSDGSLDLLSVSIITTTTSGTLVFDNTTGLLTYTPDEYTFGSDLFTYVIYDEEGAVSNTATVTIDVAINPDSDIDTDGVADFIEDINGNGNPDDDDSDGDGLPDYNDTDDDNDCILTIDEDFNNNGNYYDDDLDGDGIVNYLDDDDDGDGILSCDEYQDLDDNGIIDALEIWNSRAVDDFDSTGMNLAKVIYVLDNDSSTMDVSTLYITSEPTRAYVTVNENDLSVTYSPDFEFIGIDSFSYVICDYYDVCDTAQVFVSVEDIVLPPHLFTPNGDGINDRYVIAGLEYFTNNTLVVFNRWGNKVFELSGYFDQWDGHSNVGLANGNKQLPVGVYYYVLHYGEDMKKAGALFLER